MNINPYNQVYIKWIIYLGYKIIMTTISLTEWVTISASSNMPLYAVLSNVSAAEPLKNYYQLDGSQTPYGLYSHTAYENWHTEMPMMVKLDERSPFLDWVTQTEYKDWGWLARSHLPFETICAHLRSLTQVIMPTDEAVFFRYWDGEYLSIMLDYFVENWQDILPAFAFYWINDHYYVMNVPLNKPPQTSPWWHVPQELISYVLNKNKTPVLDNILQTLQENYPDIYWSYRSDVLTKKIERILQLNVGKSDIWHLVLQQLK